MIGRLGAALLRSAELARAYALTAFATVFGAFAIERLTGPATLATMIVGLDALGIAILIARRRELSLLRFVPTSLVAFVGWALASLAWSLDRSSSLAAWLTLLGYGIIALVVAHVRDTLQTVRALGDVLRVLLAASLAVEILAGILIDMPLPFLRIEGNLALGGPVQGIFGTRNMLGFVAVIALVTFLIEWRTQSVARGVAVFSIGIAGLLAVFSASPTVLVLALAVTAATAALALVRHAPAQHRGTWNGIFAAIVVVGLAAAYLLRHQIIRLLDAATDFSLRADLWNEILDRTRHRPVQGWGWHGTWEGEPFPLNVINYTLGEEHRSALNAMFDVLLQLGLAGAVLFGIVCAIAFVRGWLVATDRRSVVYAWTPLMLVTLLVDSVFESFTLTGLGWVMLVLCAVRAGQSRSWRETLGLAADGGDTQDPLRPGG